MRVLNPPSVLGWTSWFGVILATLTTTLHAAGHGGTATAALGDENLGLESPYFRVIQDVDGGVDAFPLKSTVVDVVISGMIADVEVTQVYGNASHAPLEAVYVFPASARCAVHGMEMQIGDQVTKAVVKKRADARATYEQARSARKNASLLEQERPNVFKMNVANILPGDEVRVSLRYTEYLKPRDGIYEYVYPTVVGPRYASGDPNDNGPGSEDWVANPYLKKGDESPSTVQLKVALNGGLPLQKVACVSHEIDVRYEDPSTAQVHVGGPVDSVGNRDFILRYQLQGREIASGLLVHEAEEGDSIKENFFLLTVQPPERVRPEQIVPRDYVFVMDVSGSMRGFPLDVSKALLEKLIGDLQPHETFNVILFAQGSRILGARPLAATRENVKKALSFIDEQGNGSTELLPALEQAFGLPLEEGHSRSVVVVTDGFVNVERKAFELVRKNLGQANLFSFGIGSSVNRYLVDGLARAGRGEPFVITSPSEARTRAADFRHYIEAPVLTDIEMDYAGFEAYDVEPKAFPDVFAKRPLVVFGKWKGSLEGEIRMSGRRGSGQRIQKVFQVAEEATTAENPGLPYLWAREQIARLSDDAAAHSMVRGGSLEEEVTAVGLAYNLLTPYTSFVAVQEKVREFAGQAVPVKQPLPLPQGVSESAIGGQSSSSPLVVSATANGVGNAVTMSASSVGQVSSGTTSIPEPSSALLVLIAALFGLLQRRR